MTILGSNTRAMGAAQLWAWVREFSQRTPSWSAIAIPYEVKPDEVFDPTLVSRRVYGTPDEFMVVVAAAGGWSFDNPMASRTLILPNARVLVDVKERLGVATRLSEREVPANFWGHPGLSRATYVAPPPPPPACTVLSESFAGGLSGYTVWRGAAAPFSVAGSVMSVAQQTDTVSNTIVRALTSTPINVDGFQIEFNLGAIQADDTGQLFIPNTALSTDPGADALSLVPARDSTADSLRRPWLYWGTANGRPMGSGSLTVGAWYRFTAEMVAAPWVRWQIENLTTPGIWGFGFLYMDSAAPFSSSRVGFNTDAPLTTGACQYRAFEMTDCNSLDEFAAMLDAATKGASVTLSSKNLAATVTAPARGIARSINAHLASEDHCFEAIIGGEADGRVMVGIVQAGANMQEFPGFDSLGRGYWGNGGSTGQRYSGGSATSFGETFTTGDHIMGRLVAGDYVLYKNGASQGVAYSGLTGLWYAAVGFGTSVAGTRAALYNGGSWAFRGGTPSGSNVWGS